MEAKIPNVPASLIGEYLANTQRLVREVLDKIRNNELIQSFRDGLHGLVRVVVSRDASWGAKTIAAGALVYFLLPVDLIPDFLPGGYLDDAAVVGAAVAAIFELEKSKGAK